MQRKIFEDQALMHEAYLGGGLSAIHALGDAGIVDSATVQAWEQIDGANPALVHAGNRMLLYREQHDIIDRFYAEMRGYSPPVGRMFTYGLTLAGNPAVPGAKGYSDVFPFTLSVPIPRRARLALRTPLAHGDLAFFPNRWGLIETDTLPAYVRLISEHGGEARSLIEQPIAERMLRFRLLRRSDRIALAALTHWRLLVESTPEVVSDETKVVIDLRTPPREARVWGHPGGQPFKVSVLLPGRRTFSTDAVLAVLLAETPGGQPSRLSIKLPPLNLAEAQKRLERLTRRFELDESEIGAWARRAAAATTATHAYSTRVFGAPPIGSVRSELQVEHHLDDDSYVLDVLFSWAD
jgi:hypothetical protein